MPDTGSYFDILGFLVNQGQALPSDERIMGYRQININNVLGYVNLVEETAQASTNSYADVTNSIIDTRLASAVAFTIKNGDNALKYKILGAHSSDFTDAVEVVAEQTLAATTNGSQSINPALFSYYKVQIKSSVNDTHTLPQIRGAAK